MLISLIANQIRLILNVKILLANKYSEKEISDKLKEHPYRVSIAKNASYNMTKESLYKILNLLFELDLNIKTGQVDKYKGLETFLLNLIY